jgi:uncharacterized protein
MFPEEKLNAIRDHLRSEFPKHEIVYDEGLDGIKFRLTYQGKSQLINFEGSFIDDNNPSQISNYLQRNSFSWLLRREDSVEVVVTNSGQKLKKAN